MCYGGCNCRRCMGEDYVLPAPKEECKRQSMEILYSTEHSILLGDIVQFKSTVDGELRKGEVVRVSQAQHRHWRTKELKTVISIRVNYKGEHGYMTCSIFHKPEHLTVVERPS